MKQIQFLIAAKNPCIAADLQLLLHGLGHSGIVCVQTGSAAVEKASVFCPDIIILDTELRDMSVLDTARRLLSIRPCALMISSQSSTDPLLEQTVPLGVAGYIIRPCSRDELHAAITLSRLRFTQIQLLMKEISELQQALKTRKVIEQAKGLLMAREHITEDAAYRIIQSMSRNQNISMVNLAEAIILSERMRKKSEMIRNITPDCPVTATDQR